MKSREYRILSVALIFFGLAVLSNPAVTDVQREQGPSKFVELVILDRGMEPEAYAEKIMSLEKAMTEHHGRLTQYFKKGDFRVMADVCERRGMVLIASDYRRIRGRDELARYWHDVWHQAKKAAEAEKADFELEFQTVRIFVTDAMGEKEVYLENIGREAPVDCVAHEIFKFRVKIIKKGETVNNQTGTGTDSFLHRHSCDWEA